MKMQKTACALVVSAVLFLLNYGTLSAANIILNDLTVNDGSTYTVPGGDRLIVGIGSGNFINIGVGSGTSGTLNSSLAQGFDANIGNFYVGTGSSGGTGWVFLGTNNALTVETMFGIGYSMWDYTTGSVSNVPGSVVTIYTPKMWIGYGIANGTSSGTGTFTLGSGSTLSLAGISGGLTELFIGYDEDQYARASSGTMNLSAGAASLKLSSLIIGRQLGNASTPGTLSLSSSASNHLEIYGTGTVATVGYFGKWGGNDGGTGNGTLSIGRLDSSSLITSTDNGTALLVGYKEPGSSGSGIGTVNLGGGVLTITTTGSGIKGGGGTSTLNLSGGVTLRAGASSTNWIGGLTSAKLTNSVTFNTAGYNVNVPQGFSGPGSFVKNGAGTLTLGGTNTYSGGTIVSNGTLLVNGSVTGTVTALSGSGFGGTGAAGGNVVFASGAFAVLTPDAPMDVFGSVTLSNNVLHVNLPEKLDIGLYPVMTHGLGARSGGFSGTPVKIDSGSAKGALRLIYSAGQVDLSVYVASTVIIIH